MIGNQDSVQARLTVVEGISGLEHVPINDAIERLRVGIDGDTCVIPVRWESPHGEIYERKSGDN